MTDFYVGLMSGTSMDGIDATLVSFENSAVTIHATHTRPYPHTLKDALLAAIREPLDVELDPSGELDRAVGEQFLDAARSVIDDSDVSRDDIVAIGSHGQTLRHQPDLPQPGSLQIGNADIIAAGTGIKTVANFRGADIAAGGQGAPLVPPFHEWLFSSATQSRVVVNIGGIANITILPSGNTPVTGFDTGPGNGLMDAWISKNKDLPFDRDGAWAAAGTVIKPLLQRLTEDAYFAASAPKSTGFEYFNLNWLQAFAVDPFTATNVQATLCELSAVTIGQAIAEHAGNTDEIFVCGGGTHNHELIRRLTNNVSGVPVATTSAVGLDPDWVEAVAFAWIAMKTVNGESGNLPSVTGASHKVVLGEIHSP